LIDGGRGGNIEGTSGRNERMSDTIGNTATGRACTGGKRIGGRLAAAAGAALAMLSSCAHAEGDFPIEGIYTQNELCRGDGSQQQFLRVKVTAQDVSYSGGICSIDSKQQDGDSLAMRVTCKFTSGAVMASAVTFTKKDNNTFDMAQNEGTYKAVLHRCPG
jgi:hypothetical protein